MQVYVLLFNPGTDNEGIHTLRRQIDGQDVVLMFEAEDDATRYGLMLEAQDFLAPSVESIDSEEVEAFCREANYEAVIVPEGTLMLPPESSLDSMDWNPDQPPSPSPSASSAADNRAIKDASPEFSQNELDEIRKRLEGLL